MSLDKCLDIFKRSFRDLTEEELRGYAVEVMRVARGIDKLTGVAAIKKAQDIVGKEFEASYFEDAQISINNKAKLEKMLAKMAGKKITMRDFVGRRYTNKSDNIESASKAYANKLMDSFSFGLDKEDITYLLDKDNQMEVAESFDGKKSSPKAEKIASALKKYIDDRNSTLVGTNAMKLSYIQGDRYLRAVHDATSMLRGGRSATKMALKLGKVSINDAKNLWIDKIKSHIDMDVTFAHTDAMDENGSIDNSKANEILSTTFDNIVTGKSDIFTKSRVINDLEAAKKKSQMFFHWKSLADQMKYNEVYGRGDLYSSIMSDTQSSATKAGAAEIMGDSPHQMYAHLRREQLKDNPKNNLWMRNTDLFFNEVTHADKMAVSPGLAAFGANLRSLTSMARLPGLVISSLTDANMAASYASRWGFNYGKAFIKQFEGVLTQATSEERKEIGRMMHVSLKSHMGYMGKFADAQNVGELTGKLSMGYYRKIGMVGWDNGNKIGLMHTTADALGSVSSKGWNELSRDTAKQLSKFGIEKNEWDILRKNNTKGLFTLDNVNNLTNDDLRKLQTANGSKQSLYEIRNDLYRKVHTMFDVASENAILTPGAWTRAQMSQGMQAGTWAGEAMRTFMQFKGFALTYIDRALIEGFKDAEGAMAKIGYGLQQFGFALPLSYLSTYAYYMSQGLSMPDESKMSLAQKVEFFGGIIAPGLGIFSGILDPTKQNENLVTSFLLTPSARLIGNAAGIPLSLAEGNFKQAKHNLSKSLQYLIPSSAIPGASPYVKQFLGEKPFLQPGQKQLYGG